MLPNLEKTATSGKQLGSRLHLGFFVHLLRQTNERKVIGKQLLRLIEHGFENNPARVSLQGEKFWSGFLIPFQYISGLYQCLMASFTRIMRWKCLVLPCHFPLKTVPKDPEPILWPSVIWPSGISQSSLESLLPKVFYSTGHLVSITALKICWKKNTEAYDNILPSYCGPRMRMTTCALSVGTATSVEL